MTQFIDGAAIYDIDQYGPDDVVVFYRADEAAPLVTMPFGADAVLTAFLLLRAYAPHLLAAPHNDPTLSIRRS